MAGSLLRRLAVAAGGLISSVQSASYNGLAVTPAMGWVSPWPVFPNFARKWTRPTHVSYRASDLYLSRSYFPL